MAAAISPKMASDSSSARLPPKQTGSNFRPDTYGFSQEGIVPDDAVSRQIFSGISRFSRPSIPALLHTHLASPASHLKASFLRAAQISSLTQYNLHSYAKYCCARTLALDVGSPFPGYTRPGTGRERESDPTSTLPSHDPLAALSPAAAE
ncbi:hypothetical protein PR048_022147 [Dryococelus australis]|uniref:Uncharacterized protein n=1 Tax=Dryococelus australis TaxID=614101 RepID=A0ABQ9H0A0_9NEOP|nr:hypothetical protein PR048_022147 [Dryococelus australis]